MILPLILIMTAWSARGQEPDTVITMLFAGDIMGHDSQIASALNDSTGTYSYDNVFRYIKPVVSSTDIAIGNLEVTLGGPPYKGYPTFSSPDALAEACRDAGFDILVTANNHAADRSSTGIVRTIRVLDSLGINHSGTWASDEARDTLTPMMIDRNGISLALLNYTYGTNGIAVPPPAIVAYIDTVRAVDDLRKAAEMGADKKIICVHWGTEYDTLPSPLQKQIAEAFIRSGADIVIGSHPHVLQPMVIDVDSTGFCKAIVWSMGNLVSNQRWRRTDGGAMVLIELTAKGDTTFISDAGYILTWVYRPTEDGKQNYYILPCAAYEDNPGFFQSVSHYDAMMLFLKDARRLLESENRGFSEFTLSDAGLIRIEKNNAQIQE